MKSLFTEAFQPIFKPGGYTATLTDTHATTHCAPGAKGPY